MSQCDRVTLLITHGPRAGRVQMASLAAAGRQAKEFDFTRCYKVAQKFPQVLLAQPSDRWSIVHQAAYSASLGFSSRALMLFLQLCPEAASLKNRDGNTPQDRTDAQSTVSARTGIRFLSVVWSGGRRQRSRGL